MGTLKIVWIFSLDSSDISCGAPEIFGPEASSSLTSMIIRC